MDQNPSVTLSRYYNYVNYREPVFGLNRESVVDIYIQE